MKQYIFLFIMLSVGVVLITACGSANQGASNKELELSTYEVVDNLDGVSMEVKEGTVTSTGLIVILENTTDKRCVYGEDFSLEKKVDGKWYKVPDVVDGNYGFNDIGFELYKDEVQEWPVDWEWLYGSLEKGEFRIVKDIIDSREPGDYDQYFLTAEFVIE
ncbi:immunoglobulin-like domain-containing protein [Ornithinibacillus halotolerans]|uniref:Bacterial Ig-like domain-containing protein n=1 Tax=Ornithinibacillus halotolerans TaxID=1274357 RepID=A0A916W5L7_9BACI|nr:immunoglobulin-like domain-containing protein [Ornithinibacillus halotolerans]GGA67939.1 hypothetical protein GCM10008025_09760 [Ornithinibacillus halotolerans]